MYHGPSLQARGGNSSVDSLGFSKLLQVIIPELGSTWIQLRVLEQCLQGPLQFCPNFSKVPSVNWSIQNQLQQPRQQMASSVGRWCSLAAKSSFFPAGPKHKTSASCAEAKVPAFCKLEKGKSSWWAESLMGDIEPWLLLSFEVHELWYMMKLLRIRQNLITIPAAIREKDSSRTRMISQAEPWWSTAALPWNTQLIIFQLPAGTCTPTALEAKRSARSTQNRKKNAVDMT